LKLAISNIAWQPAEERDVAALLRDEGLRYVEIAPTRIAPDPRSISTSALRAYRDFWSDHGIAIVAMQALLFGQPDLHVFRSDAQRSRTIDYIRVMVDIGAALAADVLVFGSPRQRTIDDLPPDYIARSEAEFFGKVGAAAEAAGIRFCIEPNPREYGCDYLNTVDDVVALLARIPSVGLGLHADAAGMTMAGDAPERLAALATNALSHFHISEPDLALIGSGGVPHERFAGALRAGSYNRYVSIEMRPVAGDAVARVRAALDAARLAYGPAR
jgi:D-psicose/D-tagatose/L-ribulose 3-epimerase